MRKFEQEFISPMNGPSEREPGVESSIEAPKISSVDPESERNVICPILRPEHIRDLTRVRKRNYGEGESAIVTTAHRAATRAALDILKQGGNAVDAAVAAAWALSVCEPSGSGLGGQTTMLIHWPDGNQVVLDGHSVAPAGASLRTVKRSKQKQGYRACTIPSTPASLGTASERFGRLSMAETICPALQLAEDGFKVSRLFRRQIQWCKKQIRSNPASAEILLTPDGEVPAWKSRFVQPALARTLKRIAKHGVIDFYRGRLARDIVQDMNENGGLITLDDLASLEVPVEIDTIATTAFGYRIVSVPPPGGGLQLLQALKIFEQVRVDRWDLYEWYRTLARTVDIVYRERYRFPLHPGQYPPSMISWLVGTERAREMAKFVQSREMLQPMKDDEGPGDTTHVCVADAEGMIVSLTQSIQSLYGAKVANRKLGFFYNNYLMTCPRHEHEAQLAPNVRPRSNAAPTLVLRDDNSGKSRPVMALGAAGSRRITSAIMETILNVVDLGFSLPEAIDAPRIHGTLSGKAYIEKRIASQDMMEQLSDHFRQVEVKASRSYAMGGVQAIARTDEGGWVGMADPRREGTADGY